MAELYRFFDSTIDDIREYTADEFAEYFRMVLTSGIYNGGTNLQVTASGTNMGVTVGEGYALINGYMYKVVEGVDLLIDTADTSQDRIDRVVLRWDNNEGNRFIKAFVLTGSPSSNPKPPALTREGNVYELSLAQVRVPAGKNFVDGSSVIDERFNTEVCGLINSMIQVDTSEVFNQFNEWFGLRTEEYEKRWNEWFNRQQTAGFVLQTDIQDFTDSVNSTLEDNTQYIEGVARKAENTLNEYLDLKTVKSEKDAEGIFTAVRYYRKPATGSGYLYCRSLLSGGVSPRYTTRTVTYYDDDGVTPLRQVVYTLSYDEDNNLISEV